MMTHILLAAAHHGGSWCSHLPYGGNCWHPDMHQFPGHGGGYGLGLVVIGVIALLLGGSAGKSKGKK